MTGVGTLMLLVSWWGAWQLFRGEALSSWRCARYAHDLLAGVQRGGVVRDRDRSPAVDCAGFGVYDRSGRAASIRTLAGTLFGYVGLYLALMIAYMKALRIMAEAGQVLEEDSNPLGTPLVGTTA